MPKKVILQAAVAQKLSQLAHSCLAHAVARLTWRQYVYSVNPTCQQLGDRSLVPGLMLTTAFRLQVLIRCDPFGGVS